jgi:hypothetical protein
MSVLILGRTSWAAMRMALPVTPCSVRAAMVCSASNWELDAPGGERAQTRATARRGGEGRGSCGVRGLRLPTRLTCIPYFSGLQTDRVFHGRNSGGL